MKKLFYVVVLAMLVAPVFAETPATTVGVQTNTPRVRIEKLAVIGNGIAISRNDPADFLVVKLALAKVHVELGDETKDLYAGVLRLDDTRYRVRNIEIENGTFEAKIYYNGTEVGYVKASSVIKGDTEVWYGELSVNDEIYNAYVVEVKRPFRPGEVVRRAASYCKENPDDERCKVISTTTSGGSVEKKIESYCKNHPDDRRCKALEKAYCLRNLDDERCRNLFREKCKENPDSEECMALKKRYMAEYCKKNPLDKDCVKIVRERLKDYCVEHPDDAKCKKPTVQSTIQKAISIKNYCIEHPGDEKCIVFCHDHPALCRRVRAVRKVGPISGEKVRRQKGEITGEESNSQQENEIANDSSESETNEPGEVKEEQIPADVNTPGE